MLDAAAEPPWWVHLIWVPVAAALTIGGLRLSKAWLLALTETGVAVVMEGGNE